MNKYLEYNDNKTIIKKDTSVGSALAGSGGIRGKNYNILEYLDGI